MKPLNDPHRRNAPLPRLIGSLALATALGACVQPAATAPPPPMAGAPRPAVPGDMLSAAPASLPGHQRHVVRLPPLENEHLHRVELIGGKTMTVDCNRHALGGQFAQREAPGQANPPSYWVFTSTGALMSTRMACPPGSEQQQFVGTRPLLLPYDSRLPLVLFVPDGFEFRWRAFDTRTAGLPHQPR